MIEDDTLDAAIAEQVIRAQFPGVCPAQVRWLGEGCDSTVFEAGAEWVFRFPKRSDVERQLLLEMRLLPILARLSPVAVPEYRFHGYPSAMYPHCFGGYRRIPGVPAIGVHSGTVPSDALAPVLARFLSWLHAFPPDEAIGLGVPQRHPASIIDEARTEALRDLEHMRAAASDGPLEEWLTLLSAATSPHDADISPVLVHGDFAAEHVLVDPETESITGVIDWSDVSVSDPSLDLAGVFHWGGQRLLDAVLRTYDGPADDAALRRVRYLAACRGVGDVVFGRETGRREYVEAGLRALTYAASS
ncbi:phosphotransferase [soil metagenome]